MGGKLFKFIPNPTFDPIIVAGCMDLMFRGQIPEGVKLGVEAFRVDDDIQRAGRLLTGAAGLLPPGDPAPASSFSRSTMTRNMCGAPC